MKRCLNCRKTYEDDLAECPYCGYTPRTKTVTTKRFERPKKAVTISIEIDPKKAKPAPTGKKNLYAASSHSGAFYMKSGERLNKRYSVISVMGFGTFGVAYECFDNFTKQHVVVKEFMPSYLCTRSPNGRDVEPISEDAEVKFSIGCDAFTDENTKLSQNNVDCVPRLIECFKQNNTSYAVTELVGGESLSSVLTRKGKLSYETTAAIITSVLQGLRRLNRLGSIHGDICPENIIVVSEDKTYLLDYNLSDFNKNMYTQRESGKPRPGYSALELYYKNMEVGPWTDVYSAAAVMYKMLTGITIPNAVKRNTSDALTPVSKLGIPIASGAEKAMFKALKIDNEKRTQSPEDFLNGFVGDGFDNITAVKGKKKQQTAPSRNAPAQKPRGDGTGFLKAILVMLILAIIGVVIWFFASGVFRLPDPIANFLGMSDGSESESDVFAPDDEEEEDDEEPRDKKKHSEDHDDTSSKVIGDIFSDVVSDVVSGANSYIEEAESAVESIISEYTDSSSEYYDYDDYDYDDEYDNDYGENDGYGYDDTTSEYEEAPGTLESYIGEAQETVSDITDALGSLAENVGI